jgi:hypothetical protein
MDTQLRDIFLHHICLYMKKDKVRKLVRFEPKKKWILKNWDNNRNLSKIPRSQYSGDYFFHSYSIYPSEYVLSGSINVSRLTQPTFYLSEF